MTKEANWYGLNMLPLYVEMSEGQLDASIEQLNNLKQVQEKPHVLNKITVERIIKLHRSQNADAWVFFEQCKKWRADNPNSEELKLIARVEKSINKLEAINNEIIALADSLKNSTIDSILDKEDFDLGLEYLLKKSQLISH